MEFYKSVIMQGSKERKVMMVAITLLIKCNHSKCFETTYSKHTVTEQLSLEGPLKHMQLQPSARGRAATPPALAAQAPI